MATEEEVEEAIEDLINTIDEVADDTRKFTQQQSIDIWSGVMTHCNSRAALTRSEM